MIQEGLQLASGNYNFSTVCIQEVSLIVSNYFQETMFSVQENEIPNHNLLISRSRCCIPITKDPVFSKLSSPQSIFTKHCISASLILSVWTQAVRTLTYYSRKTALADI